MISGFSDSRPESWHKWCCVFAECRELADEGGADYGMVWVGEEEDGLNVGGETAVDVGYATLVLVVGGVAHATNNIIGAHLAAEIGGQRGVGPHINVAKTGDSLANQFNALLERLKGPLGYIDTNCHHHSVEQSGGLLDKMQVTYGERIERTGK